MVHTATKKNYMIEKVKIIANNHKRFQTVSLEQINSNRHVKKDDIIQRNKIVKTQSPMKNSDKPKNDMDTIKKSNLNFLSKNFKKD